MTQLTPKQKSTITGWLAFVFSALTILLQEFFRIETHFSIKMTAVFLLLMAVPFIFLSFSALKKYGKSPEGNPYYNTTTVANLGIYSVVRHPQYLGYILLTTGFILLSCHLLVMLMGILAIMFHIIQTLTEETYCRDKLGEAYEQYCKTVPRFNIFLGIARKWKNMRR